MKTKPISWNRHASAATTAAYMMVEVVAYVAVVFVILGLGYMVLYRCIDNSVALRRNAEDIVKALRVGERWRADVRAALPGIQLESTSESPTLRLPTPTGAIFYRFASNSVSRRVADGPWVQVLPNVVSSTMAPEQRPKVTVWLWELELRPQGKAMDKPGRVPPVFTFLAVPRSAPPVSQNSMKVEPLPLPAAAGPGGTRSTYEQEELTSILNEP